MSASHTIDFLKQLLGTPGPSGDEAAVARIWRAEAETFADEVTTDINGNSFALLKGEGHRVLMAGHIDEIGFMVSYIDDDGYLSFAPLGGWDAQVLVGQRVRVLGKAGEVVGVIGKKPIHLMDADDRGKASKIKDLWIDIGARNREEASERVRVGSSGVLDAALYEFPHGRIVSRSLDNRIGAYTVLEALRLLSAERPVSTVAAVATTQEELSFAGSRTAAFGFRPSIAIAVDVTFATDHPGSDKNQYGDVKLGGGPVLSRGSANNPVIYNTLLEIAEREKIPFQVQITPQYTGTDADAIHNSRGGVATAVISIPNRYMHSPNEMIELADVENAAKLIASFIRSLAPDTDLTPR
jgi:putative aminopeptidase FrvX